ncbi:hypothetical protein CBM2595_A80160 [Cupriavidus taiwanensis]|uniref:Uncharacterized protein n=1 Tax=Cupriavidus taiwanensis TaxID=164546 RepID=A0A7Z7J7U1_9BURK|nr:hypothetical protein CBM2595_A80160 [Cupriavidus taiwanensis]SOZ07459.1 hypothetical protein CBM2597_A90065 [Cupriavidus taiwanensis]SPC15499.1 hypothetical protein CBM2594_A70064 [Cupriavidus taiwanensis]
MGADQRLSRRDRHPGQDGQAGGARHLLHPQLVVLARPAHHLLDRLPRLDGQQCLLSQSSPSRPTEFRYPIASASQ